MYYFNKRDGFRVYNKLIKRIPAAINYNVRSTPQDFCDFISQMRSAYQFVIYDDLHHLLTWKKKNPKKSYRRLVAYSDILFSIEDLLTYLIKSSTKDTVFSIVYISFYKSLWSYEICKDGEEYKLTSSPSSYHKDFTADLLEETISRSDIDELSDMFIERWLTDHMRK